MKLFSKTFAPAVCLSSSLMRAEFHRRPWAGAKGGRDIRPHQNPPFGLRGGYSPTLVRFTHDRKGSLWEGVPSSLVPFGDYSIAQLGQVVNTFFEKKSKKIFPIFPHGLTNSPTQSNQRGAGLEPTACGRGKFLCVFSRQGRESNPSPYHAR